MSFKKLQLNDTEILINPDAIAMVRPAGDAVMVHFIGGSEELLQISIADIEKQITTPLFLTRK